jgi:DNA-binding MurR/RpiR family transcriptional regulator
MGEIMAKPLSVVPHSSHSNVLELIQSQLETFHASEIAIANSILKNPQRTATMNITQLAKFSKTSVSSVVRFSKTLGFRGYPEFKMALVGDLSWKSAKQFDTEFLDGGITPTDSLSDIIEKVTYSDARAIESTAEKIDIATFKKVIELFEKAKLIGLFGLVSSGFVAMDFQSKLNRLSKRAIAWTDFHSAMTSIAVLEKGDVLVAITHSGTTVDTVDAMREFKERGVTIVLITNAMRSPAVSLADFVIHTAARETTFRSGATASRIAQLTVVDCLCVALAQRNWSGTKSALDLSRAAVSIRSGKNHTYRPRGGN